MVSTDAEAEDGNESHSADWSLLALLPKASALSDPRFPTNLLSACSLITPDNAMPCNVREVEYNPGGMWSWH